MPTKAELQIWVDVLEAFVDAVQEQLTQAYVIRPQRRRLLTQLVEDLSVLTRERRLEALRYLAEKEKDVGPAPEPLRGPSVWELLLNPIQL